MTKPTTKKFGEYIVQIESSDSPGVFVAPCGLTTKGFTQTASTNETNVPDCDDPDLPADVERDIVSRSRSISGSGVMATESQQLWQDFYDSGSRTCRVYPAGLTGGYWEGDFILTSLEFSAALGEKVNISVTMDSDGPAPWTPGS